jgi:hypothetical protein
MKKVFYVMLLGLLLSCNKIGKNIEPIKSTPEVQLKSNNWKGVIDSIEGGNNWYYIFGQRKGDSAYSSLRIISHRGDTLYFIDKDSLRNKNGCDWRNNNEETLFYAFKLNKKNNREFELLTVDSSMCSYGESTIIHWSVRANTFEIVKW